MKHLLFLMLMAICAWQGYQHFEAKKVKQEAAEQTMPATPQPIYKQETEIDTEADKVETSQPFSCDGRTRCPQMKSCEEATYFIENCPGTEMDGDHDGVPCEEQWCKW